MSKYTHGSITVKFKLSRDSSGFHIYSQEFLLHLLNSASLIKQLFKILLHFLFAEFRMLKSSRELLVFIFSHLEASAKEHDLLLPLLQGFCDNLAAAFRAVDGPKGVKLGL